MFSPLMADKSHRWHDVEHLFANRTRYPFRLGGSAKVRITLFILWPQAMHDEAEPFVDAALLVVATALGSGAEGRRP
ncbi:hypothetical protein D3C80_565320 [compost metagenome]